LVVANDVVILVIYFLFHEPAEFLMVDRP